MQDTKWTLCICMKNGISVRACMYMCAHTHTHPIFSGQIVAKLSFPYWNASLPKISCSYVFKILILGFPFYSTDLSVFICLYFLNYGSLIILLEIRWQKPCNFLLLFKCCLAILYPLHFNIIFRISLTSLITKKKAFFYCD